MLDTTLRPLITPQLDAGGRSLAAVGATANGLSCVGVLITAACGFAIATGHFHVGLVLIVLNRLADGLDGAVARATGRSDFGGYLDIVADFAFYVTVPVGFGLAAPGNEVPAMMLLACFTLTGISFLAVAAIAAERGDETDRHGTKSIFYSNGLVEGSETIIAFALMCLAPHWFPHVAWTLAALCAITVVQRGASARRRWVQPDQ